MAESEFQSFLAGKVRDADTFEDEAGIPKRLIGVNAPEAGTPAGDAATRFVERTIAERGIDLKETGRKGVFKRDLVEARLTGTETPLSSHLIALGHGRPIGAFDEFDEAGGLAEASSTTSRVLGLQDRGVQNEIDIDLSGEIASDFRSRRGTFGRAVGRGVDQVQQLGFSASNVGAMAVGDIIGTEVLDTWGEEGMRRNMIEAAMNPATIESWDNVTDLETFFTYAVEALGEQMPNIATMVGSGGILTAAKAGGGALVKASIAKKLQQQALKTGNNVKIAKAKNAKPRISDMTKGVAATSFVFGTGEIGNELREGGIDSPVTALIGAVPFAALDTIGFQATIGRFFRGIDKDIATQSVKDIATNVFKAAGVGAGAESSTEMLQEVISLSSRAFHDPTFEIFSDENLHRIREAGIKAGLVGAVGAGAGTTTTSVVGKLSQPRDEAITPEGAVDEEAGQPPAPPGAGVTTFNQRDTDYGYIDPESSVPASEVFEGAPEGDLASIRGILEQEIEPQMLSVERTINAHEALRRCLAS